MSSRDCVSTRVIGVVVTFNGSAWIEKCLASITSGKHEIQIVVVDNLSTDQTMEIVSRFPDVEYIQMSRNVGFGVANNIGIGRGIELGADFVLLVNQDAYLVEGAVDTLVEQMQENPELGIVSPLHWNCTGSNLDMGFQNYIYSGSQTFVSDLLHDAVKSSYQVPFVNAAIWLVSRQCIERIGGFDPLFFMYGEDVDYCRRTRYHGLHVAIVPSAHAHHIRATAPQTKTVWQNLRRRSEYIKSLLVLDLKDPAHSLLYLLLQQLLRIFRTTFTELFRRNLFEIFAYYFAFVKALLLIPRIQKHRILDVRGTKQWI